MTRDALVWMTVCAVTKCFSEDPELVVCNIATGEFRVDRRQFRIPSDEVLVEAYLEGMLRHEHIEEGPYNLGSFEPTYESGRLSHYIDDADLRELWEQYLDELIDGNFNGLMDIPDSFYDDCPS